MQVPGFFFNQLATIRATAYPQDSGGGEVITPRAVDVQVPVCVQGGSGRPTEGQGRRGSVSETDLFFQPTTPPQRDAVAGLKVNDQVAISGPGGSCVISLDSPPFDVAGRGVVWEARGRDVR